MPRKTEGAPMPVDKPYITELIEDGAKVKRFQIIETASRGVFHVLDHEGEAFVLRDETGAVARYSSEGEARAAVDAYVAAQAVKKTKGPSTKKKEKKKNGIHPPVEVAPEVIAAPVEAKSKRSHHAPKKPATVPAIATVAQVTEERKKDPRGRKPDMRDTIRAYLSEGKLTHDEIFEKVAPIFKLTIAKRYYIDWYWKEMTKGKK
jgi:hypothetical protein